MSDKRRLNRSNSLSKGSGEHTSDNWAISYGDMVTLLLAFFVLFFSTTRSSPDIHLVAEELKKEFNHIDVPEANLVWGTSEEKGASTQVSLDGIGVQMNTQGNKIIVEFPKVSFFNTGSYHLTPDGELAIKKFGSVLKNFTSKMRIVVRGYTDNRPVRHTQGRIFKDNLELSSLRAISALRVMNQEGIPYHLLRIGGYGETDKGDEISSESIRKFDRKIVLVIEELDKTERNMEGLYTSSKDNLDQINKDLDTKESRRPSSKSKEKKE